MFTSRRISNTDRPGGQARKTISALAAMAATTAFLISPSAVAAETTDPTQDPRGPGIVYHGDDAALFDFNREEVSVCDKEKDGHAVYAYLRLRNDMDSTILYDNTSGCTTHKIEPESAYKYVAVCEAVWGPDWCTDPVYLR